MPEIFVDDQLIAETVAPKTEALSNRVLSASNLWHLTASGACGAMLGMCWLQLPGPVTAAIAWSLWTLILLFATSNSARSSAANWFAAGMTVRAVAFQWIPSVVAENFDIAYPVAAVFFLLMIAFESTTWALLGLVAFYAFRKRTVSIWVIPSLVIVVDHFWPRVFPWTMAHMLVGSDTLSQTVDLGGTLGLTWLMTGVSCAIVVAVNRRHRRNSPASFPAYVERSRSDAAFSATMVVLTLAAVIYGAWSESRWKLAVRELKGIDVAAVQVDSSFVRAEGKRPVNRIL